MFHPYLVILQKLIQEKNMHKYTHVILDEIHEREVDMDLLMTLIKELHWENSMHTKIILMSATLDEATFMKYFTYHATIVPGIVTIKAKRGFNIRELYLDDMNLNLQDDNNSNLSSPGIKLETFQAAVKIIKERLAESRKSILVFLPGIYEIKALRTLLQDDSDFNNTCLVCILHSSLSTDDQKIAFTSASKPKIVLSSNVAESSVTITGPEVDCVIDFCLTKYIEATDRSSRVSLKLAWAPQDSLKQRAGRTGRTCDGTVIRMIYRPLYDLLQPKAIPEMQRIPLETVVLRVKRLEVAPIGFLCKAISPPKQDDVVHAVLILKELGGLQRFRSDGLFDSNDGDLTFVGSIMAALPLDVRISKFISLGYAFSVLDECIIIGAGMNVKSIFRHSYRKELDTFVRHLSWADGSGCDFIAILNAYRFWCFTKEQGHFTSWDVEKAWCERFNLERKNLHEMRQLINEIKLRLKELDVDVLDGRLAVSYEQNEKPLILKICVAGAFLPNYFICGESSEIKVQEVYKTMRSKNPLNTIIFRCNEKINIGKVYEEQIKKKIVAAGICKNINEVEVEFEKGSSKIFVTFPESQAVDSEDLECKMSSSSVPGKVVSEIYKAVKLRQMGTKFTVDTMNDRDTEAYAVANGLGEMANGWMFEHFNHFYRKPEMVVIPTTCTKQLKGVVSHIDHIGKFFIQPVNADRDLLKLIEETLEEAEVIIPYTDAKELKRHQNVLLYHSMRLKRAKIASIDHSSETASCYLYDFGKVVEMKLEHIFIVPASIKHLYDIPPRCFEAFLHELQPSIYKCPREQWTTEAIERFQELISNQVCNVEVYSVHNEVSSVVLTRNQLNINRALIEEGYAREQEETFPHNHDHELREQCQFHKTRYFNAKDEFGQKLDTSVKIEIPSPPSHDCVNRIYLQGPISPLEAAATTSILINSAPVDIKIDPLSINSVAFCDDPNNFYGRLLVSAHMSSSHRETILHQTSLMPNVPGMAEILAMMLAPAISFTRDETNTRFTSLRFGLGAHPNGQPLFAEHDCVLPVNVLIDVEDFDLINELRFSLSYLLMTQPQADIIALTEVKKSEFHRTVKKLVKKIMSKTRPVLPPFFVNPTRNWEVIDTIGCKFFLDGGDYCQISHPFLHPYNPMKIADLREKLDELVDEMEM